LTLPNFPRTLAAWQSNQRQIQRRGRAWEKRGAKKYYVVEGALNAPDGRSPKVRVVWYIAKNAESAVLATAYPLDI